MTRALRRGACAVPAFLVAAALGLAHGCQPVTRNNPGVCASSDECGQGVCVAHRCQAAAGGQATGPGGNGGQTSAGGAGAGGLGGQGATAGTIGLGGGLGSGGSSSQDAGVDTKKGCNSPDDCKTGAPGKPVCDLETKACVECGAAGDCHDPTKAFCSAAKTCVSCALAGPSACSGTPDPFCGTTGQCVECAANNDCAGSPTKPFCSPAGACVPCAMAPAGASCATLAPTKPVCGPGGACVECVTDDRCLDQTKPFCSSDDVCVPCAMAAADACAKKDGRYPFCGSTGACVECAADKDCAGSPTTPFCSAAGACVSCANAPAGASCATLTPTKPVCASSGACVQCVANGDCPSTTPVCSGANTCGACAADADCAGRAGGPTVCMSHQDGRCAIDAETIYVQNNVGCSDGGGNSGGTAAAPYCSMQPAVAAFGATRDLVVVRGSVNGATSAFSGTAKQVSIVGQSAAAVLAGANPAIRLAAGDSFIRDLRLTTAGSIGCQADAGATLRLQHLVINGNSGGGILLDGAGFDIRNTTVTGNGPGTSGAVSWGGILVNNPPAGGPNQLQLVTVQNNMQVGITCSAAIQGSGVLASGNIGGVDINPTCHLTACAAASATCGAQP